MNKILFSLFLATSLSQAETVLWQTYLIQSQINGSEGTPNLVDDEGTTRSIPIGEDGSRFELWGWKFVDGVVTSEVLLDTTEVGIFLPTAEISIFSKDPFNGFHRSRVDQPFSVTFDADNLKTDTNSDFDISARSIYVEHYVDLYTEGSFDGSSVESTILVDSFFIEDNEPLEVNYALTNLVAPNIARRSGKERFIAYSVEENDDDVRELARAEIVMLPIPEGSIAEIDQTVEHRELPDFDSIIYRAYPSSSTWVEIYDGNFATGTRGTKLDTTFETAGFNLSDSETLLSFSDFSEDLQPKGEGVITFVLRTSSPFPGESIDDGGIILDSETINVRATLKINGMLTDMSTAEN